MGETTLSWLVWGLVTCHTAQVWINSWGSDANARHRELSLGRKGGQEAQAFWEAPGNLMGGRYTKSTKISRQPFSSCCFPLPLSLSL